MPIFSYKAVDSLGNYVSGVFEAESQEHLIKILHEKGCVPTKIEKQKEKVSPSFFDKMKGISLEDIYTFTTELGTMLSSGLTLADSLRDLSSQTENLKFRKILSNIEEEILAGESLSNALSKHPKVFSNLYTSMISAGEAGGALDVILNRLSSFLEKEINIRQRIRTALTYPIVLLLVSVFVIVFILVKFVPQFVSLFSRMNVALPLPTLILYKGSIFLKSFGLLILGGIVFLTFVLKNYVNTKSGRFQFDLMKLKLPIFGNLFLRTSTSRFLRTLGTLYASGISIVDSVDIAENTMGNVALAKSLSNVEEQLKQGESLAEPLRHSGIFSPMIIRMVSTGEKSGALDDMLNKAADFYDLEVDNTIQRLSALLEPVILVIMGAIIGFIMASTLLPMFQMVKLLRRH